jgi:TolA-binding protein
VLLTLSQSDMRKLGDIVVKAQTESERFKPNGLQISVAEEIPATVLIASDEAEQLFQRAREQIAAGDRESTVQTLQEIIQRFPTSRWAAKAQKTLSNAGL